MTSPIPQNTPAPRRRSFPKTGEVCADGVEAVTPVRMRLSRAKGFNLQEASQAINGLEAIKVTRPGIWGNPFTVTEALAPGVNIRAPLSGGYIAVPTVADAVACYAEMMEAPAEGGQRAYELRKRLPNLRGKNLACWCALPAPGEPDHCHAAVLLRLANVRCDDPASPPPAASPGNHEQER